VIDNMVFVSTGREIWLNLLCLQANDWRIWSLSSDLLPSPSEYSP
jgi:hypothetical protein